MRNSIQVNDEPIKINIGNLVEDGERAATKKQIVYLKALCALRNIKFPFEKIEDAMKCLPMFETSLYISHLLSGGQLIFV